MKYRARLIPQSGIPLGGIGTGYLELRADGRFYEWNIFNNKPWRGWPGREEFLGTDGLFFALGVRGRGAPLVRLLRLDASELGGDPYITPWLKGVEEIEYDGEFPLVKMTFRDRDLPIEVRLTAYSPFIPGDTKDSSLPLAVFEFELTNPRDCEMDVSLLAALENPFPKGVPGAVGTYERIEGEGFRGLVLGGEGVPDNHPMYGGSMALAALNGDVSTCAVPRPGDLTNIFQVRGTEYLDALVAFRREGSLPPRLPQRSRERSYAMVASRTALKPGGRTTLRFVLAWYFPNHIDADGNRLGHAYENWFGSAREVVKYAVGNLERLRRYTFVFHDTLYDTTLDRWVVDLATSQLTSLVHAPSSPVTDLDCSAVLTASMEPRRAPAVGTLSIHQSICIHGRIDPGVEPRITGRIDHTCLTLSYPGNGIEGTALGKNGPDHPPNNRQERFVRTPAKAHQPHRLSLLIQRHKTSYTPTPRDARPNPALLGGRDCQESGLGKGRGNGMRVTNLGQANYRPTDRGVGGDTDST